MECSFGTGENKPNVEQYGYQQENGHAQLITIERHDAIDIDLAVRVQQNREEVLSVFLDVTDS